MYCQHYIVDYESVTGFLSSNLRIIYKSKLSTFESYYDSYRIGKQAESTIGKQRNGTFAYANGNTKCIV